MNNQVELRLSVELPIVIYYYACCCKYHMIAGQLRNDGSLFSFVQASQSMAHAVIMLSACCMCSSVQSTCMLTHNHMEGAAVINHE